MKNYQKKSIESPTDKKNKIKNNNLTKPSTAAAQTGENEQLLQNMTNKAQRPADLPIEDFGKVNYVTVGANQAGQRIDNFLLARLKGLPRSHVYKLLRDHEIRLNKKRVKPHARLAVGDVVRIAPVRLSTPKACIVGDGLKQALLACVVYEDEGYLVLDKPTGLAVHGGSGETAGVIEAMRQATAKPYLELVHRIDKGTSGLLMIAKKRSALKKAQEQFSRRQVKKTYLCVVTGSMPLGERCIDQPLLKYLNADGERRVRVEPSAKPSLTHIRVLAHGVLDGQAVSLVQAYPHTGRTHQIRVHLASVGFAIVGDDKYNPAYDPRQKRLYLHAWQLSLHDMPPLVAKIPTCFYAPFTDMDWKLIERCL